MESKLDADIWELVYLSTRHHRDAQPETFIESHSNRWSESALQYLVQYIIMAGTRAAAAEERLKQTQVRMEGAIKLLPNLIESLGTGAATVGLVFFFRCS